MSNVISISEAGYTRSDHPVSCNSIYMFLLVYVGEFLEFNLFCVMSVYRARLRLLS